ncbi:MAG TPA: hypothetical protein VNY24_14100 [Candidatus Acidoferrales bacterium]|nr:hypothetical protein [Candidatus Acidoferrales bacterium]
MDHQFSWVFFSDYKDPPTHHTLVFAELALLAKVLCTGISAPALLFWFFGALAAEPRLNTQPLSVVGFNLGEILFFLWVVVLWYFIGRAIERHWSSKSPKHKGLTIFDFCVLLSLMIWGLILFVADIWFLRYVSLSEAGWTLNSYLDFPRIAVMSMALIWSMLLVLLPARTFSQALRQR